MQLQQNGQWKNNMKLFSDLQEDLRKWFSKTDPAGDWKRINSKGEAIGPCAREPGEPKPKCMSAEKRASLTKKERASAVRAKRKNDPNPERKGKPINVSNFGKGKISESMKNLNEKNVPTSPEKWAQAKSQAKAKFDVYPSAYANGWAAKKYKAMGGSWKSVSEAKEKTEYDYEGDMARGQLQSIISNAQRVHDMLEDDTNIAEWVQSKITLAEDYISTVANYMMSELDEAKEVGDDPIGGEPEPNLSVKKGKTVITNPITEATSARARLADAMKRAQEQREREERAGAALLKPKPKTEEVMVEREDDEYHTPSKHHVQVQVSKGDGQKTYRKATVKAKEPKHAVSAAIAHYKQQGYTVHDHKYLGEDVEQIDELMKSTIEKYKDKVYTGYRNDGGKTANSFKRIAGVKSANKRLLDNKYGVQRNRTTSEETVQEGRASQRHPLEGHEYHKKSDEALVHIAKDAHAAAEAMKSHNTTAENKYRDQANDSATVRHFRKTSGTPDWYKKKYGHMKESFKPMDEPNYNNSIEARQKKADNAAKRFMDNSVQDRQKKADDAAKRFMQGADKPPFDGPYKKSTGVVTDKSGAKHGGMSIARNLAKQALKKQSSKMSVKEGLEESRKAEIVKEIMKKGKKKEDNSFQGEPELGSTVVKADN